VTFPVPQNATALTLIFLAQNGFDQDPPTFNLMIEYHGHQPVLWIVSYT